MSSDIGTTRVARFSGVINLLNTILGAGLLAMPAAMARMGMTLGVFAIVTSAFTSALGLYLQAACAWLAAQAFPTTYAASSFSCLASLVYPSAQIWFNLAIAIKCFGVAVSYLIIIGDLMPDVIRGFFASLPSSSVLFSRNFWITIFMFIIIPVSFLRQLKSLRYTSFCALIAIAYLLLLVLVHVFWQDTPLSAPRELHIFRWRSFTQALASLPVVIFSYTCHQNMFPILHELRTSRKPNSEQSISGPPSASQPLPPFPLSAALSLIYTSISVACGVYLTTALAGYLTFGDSVRDIIVNMYPPSIFSTIARVAIVTMVTFTYPLQIHPCRISFHALLDNTINRISLHNPSSVLSTLTRYIRERFSSWKYRMFNSTLSREQPTSSSMTLLNPSTPSITPDSLQHLPCHTQVTLHSPRVVTMSDASFAVLTTILLLASYTLALRVESLDRVLAYVGSTGSTCISFILPAILYVKLSTGITHPSSLSANTNRLSRSRSASNLRPSTTVSSSSSSTSTSTSSSSSTLSNLSHLVYAPPVNLSSPSTLPSYTPLHPVQASKASPIHFITSPRCVKLARLLILYGLFIMVTCLFSNLLVS